MGLERSGIGYAEETLAPYGGFLSAAIGAWFFMSDLNGRVLVLLSSSSGVGSMSIILNLDGTIIGETSHVFGIQSVISVATYSVNTWHHVIYFEVISGERVLWLDGVQIATDSTSLSFTGNFDKFRIFSTGTGFPVFKKITGAEWFYFHFADPTDATVEQYMIHLAKGASPFLPLYSPVHGVQNLPVAYIQGFKGVPYDIIQGQVLTETGNTIVKDRHPSMIYPY